MSQDTSYDTNCDNMSHVELYFKNKRKVWTDRLLIKYKFLFKNNNHN